MVNVVGNLILIPKFGIVGAASSTSISYFIMTVAIIIKNYAWLPIKYSIKQENLSKVNRWFLACPALPTCGLALAEAERVRNNLINKIDEILNGKRMI